MALVQDHVIFGRQQHIFFRPGNRNVWLTIRVGERFSGADLTDFGSSERVLERDGERATLANIIHQGRPETRDAGSGFVPNAVIDDAG